MAQQANEQGVPISLDASLTLVAGLCAGLHYAHEKVGADGKPLEIVHRDVSPSNVLVSYDGAVKLVDFGIARATQAADRRRTAASRARSRTCRPSSAARAGALDRRSDVFSIGTMLYELTTGQLPFTGETEYQLLDQIVNRDVPPPSTVVPGLSRLRSRRIVLRALARDRDRRYPSALELQGAARGLRAREPAARVAARARAPDVVAVPGSPRGVGAREGAGRILRRAARRAHPDRGRQDAAAERSRAARRARGDQGARGDRGRG